MVLHTCDVRHCVNPAHLYEGTAQQNRDDCFSRHRAAVGSMVATALLTEWQVAQLRADHAAGGVTQVELAERYGVSRTTVSYIVNRKSWKHV